MNQLCESRRRLVGFFHSAKLYSLSLSPLIFSQLNLGLGLGLGLGFRFSSATMTLLKVAILGDPSVGKSKLANKFETYNAQIKIDGKEWNMEISTGQQSSMIPHELTEMHCCVLVFDVNNRKSFDNLPRHMDQFAIHAHPRAYDFKYIVLGNKTDEGRRVVSTEEALEWCSNNREALYFETSAKAGWNVELAFDHIIRAAIGYSSSSPPTGPKIYNLQDLLVHDLHGIFFASRERRLEAHEVHSILGHLDSLTQYATMTPNYVKLGLFLTEANWEQDSDHDLIWTDHYDGQLPGGGGDHVGIPAISISFARCTLLDGRCVDRYIYDPNGIWKIFHYRIGVRN